LNKIVKQFSLIIITLWTILIPVTEAAMTCDSINGVWVGNLEYFSAVKLVIKPVGKSPTQKSAAIQYVDTKSQSKSYDLPAALCQLKNNTITLNFFRNKDGVEIYLNLYMKNDAVLQVLTYSVNDHHKYDRVKGVLIK